MANSNLDESYALLMENDQGCFEALEIIQDLVRRNPTSVDYRDALACIAGTIGSRYFPKNSNKGLELLQLAYSTAADLKAELPEPCQQWAHVGGSAARISEFYIQNGDLEKAASWLSLAIREIKDYLDRDNVEPGELAIWVDCLANQVKLERLRGNDKLADSIFKDCGVFINDCAKKYPDYFVFQEMLAKLPEYEFGALRK